MYGAKSYYGKAGGLSGSNKRGTFQKIQGNSNIKPPKQHVNLKFLECENVKSISRKALASRGGTVRSTWTEEVLPAPGMERHRLRNGNFRKRLF